MISFIFGRWIPSHFTKFQVVKSLFQLHRTVAMLDVEGGVTVFTVALRFLPKPPRNVPTANGGTIAFTIPLTVL
jgi:hypothetical protein